MVSKKSGSPFSRIYKNCGGYCLDSVIDLVHRMECVIQLCVCKRSGKDRYERQEINSEWVLAEILILYVGGNEWPTGDPGLL